MVNVMQNFLCCHVIIHLFTALTFMVSVTKKVSSYKSKSQHLNYQCVALEFSEFVSIVYYCDIHLVLMLPQFTFFVCIDNTVCHAGEWFIILTLLP